MRIPGRAGSAALALLALLSASAVRAQDAAAFYKDRVVELQIGYSVGGGYDIYGRLLARHIGRHIPGQPAVVARNMPGAGSLKLANWLYGAAPRDGTVIGTIGRGIAMEPLLGNAAARFDARGLLWLGSANDEVSLCAAWHSSGIASFADMIAGPLIVGGTGAGADTDVFATVINAVFGAKMKLVSGYPGGNDITLAMERGEVDGRCGWSWSSLKANHAKWVSEGKVRLLVQLGLAKHPDLPDVPLILDLARTEEQRQILRLIFARQVMGRPFLAPPGIPPTRAEALRAAFMATMADPAFLSDAEKSQLEITPVSGAALDRLLRELYATAPEIVGKAALAAHRAR